MDNKEERKFLYILIFSTTFMWCIGRLVALVFAGIYLIIWSRVFPGKRREEKTNE